MPIELPNDAHQQAITSIERYFREHVDEPVDNVTAGALLGFFLKEIGPSIHNRAVADVQDRLRMRVAEVDVEEHEDESGYWQTRRPQPRGRT